MIGGAQGDDRGPPPPQTGYRGGGRKTGVAGRWNSRGFGFIIPDHGGEDVFCHLSAITDGNMVRHQSDPEHRIYGSFADSANRHGP